ncbi:MAG: CBS domain-containing protein [Desulfobulbaceae bacterium]|nr:CBS domain-containing protein [Desulfobulbaceae bacterium]
MPLLAKDLMSQQYDIIHQDALVSQAVEQLLLGGTRETGHKNVSLVVVDDNNALVGTISMYSILYHLRPSYQLFGIDISNMAVNAELEVFIKTIQRKRVRDIMNDEVVVVSPEEPMMHVLDRLMRNRVRRVSVVDKGVMVGIIYMTDIFYHLFDNPQAKEL